MSSAANRVGLLPIILIFSISMSLLGCASKKKLHPDTPEKKSQTYLNEKLRTTGINYSTLAFRATVKSELNGEKTNCKASVRIRKDSAIWVLISVVGKPVATLIVSRDTVKFQNKIKKEYFIGRTDYLSRLAGVDIGYDFFQQILTAKAIEYKTEENYDSHADTSSYLLCAPACRKIKKAMEAGASDKHSRLYRYWLDPDNYAINKQIVNNLSDSTSITSEYSQYLDVEGQRFPKKQDILITSKSDTVAVGLTLTKIKLNENQSYPFRITEKYSRID